MTKLIRREGNIFDTLSKGVGHGVNTVGVMGAGIALQFKNMFVDMYDEYRLLCSEGRLHGGDIFPWQVPNYGNSFIYNIASQELPGANASYDFLEEGVRRALLHAESCGLGELALPRIGSGIGGLDEAYVEGILFALTKNSPVDIELWTYKG